MKYFRFGNIRVMSLLETMISTVAPHACLSCGREGKIICNLCRPDICLPIPSRCYLCKAATQDFAVCDKCRRKSALRHVWVASEFENLVKELIHKFKFGHAQAATPIIAQYMSDCLPFVEDMLIVPLPTASSRARLRGYDHTKLIAKQLSMLRHLPYAVALSRMGQTRQVGAKRAERTKQLEGSFWVNNKSVVNKERILLVDDVTTTGATLGVAAKALKRAGAKQVNAVVFADVVY